MLKLSIEDLVGDTPRGREVSHTSAWQDDLLLEIRRPKVKLTYWLASVVLASALVATGVQQLLRVEAVGATAPPFAWGIRQLGYPVYVLTILSHMEAHLGRGVTHP